jgi:AraC family transcriptional regulator
VDVRNRWETGVALLEDAPRGIATSPAETPPLSMVLSNLLDAAAAAFDVDQERSRALLLQARALLQSGTARDGLTARLPAQPVLAPWQAKRVAGHIEDNLDRALPIDELAGAAGLSNSHFTRAFKGTFGQAPHAFILARRVERARQEMLEGHDPLSQIALSCGFADQAHLARIFRRATGIAPSEWRRAHQAANLEPPGAAAALNQLLDETPSPTPIPPLRGAVEAV